MSGHSYSTAAPLPRGLKIAHGGEERRPAGLAGPLLLGASSLVALLVVWAVAEFVPAAHVRDATLLGHFLARDYGSVHSLADHLPRLLNPLLFTLWSVALVLTALARERPRVALAVALVLALAPLSAEVLKPLLAHSHLAVGRAQVDAASFPSGHSTAAAIVAIGAVLVATPRLRPAVAALGALFALAVGAALLVRGAHMPSDVLGGYLLALMWAALAVAGVRISERRRSPGAIAG
ncbi:MAG TPA: phosphatase PAP2 family protein [Solirubrobacteraceae bacterium]|nr:phosphatase PAP2 family protein [Solirubrobacteraceae bacterium]